MDVTPIVLIIEGEQNKHDPPSRATLEMNHAKTT